MKCHQKFLEESRFRPLYSLLLKLSVDSEEGNQDDGNKDAQSVAQRSCRIKTNLFSFI